MLEKARQLAVEAHGEQKYGDEPYSSHLDAVVDLLESYGDDAKVIGYLHDILDDTDVDIRTIEREFGHFISECVSILRDEPGENRKERKDKTYAKLARITGKEQLALVVCVADRLSNIQACIIGVKAELPTTDKNLRKMKKKLRERNKSLLKMYRSEQSDFRNAVYRAGLCDELWSQIDSALGN